MSWTLPCDVGPVQPSTHAGLVGGASSSRRSTTTACPAEKTSRKRLIIGGLHTEICLAFAVAQGLKDGYEVMFVTDVVGGRSQTAHRTAIERMSQAGAVPTTALAVVAELFRDWNSPLADKAREVIYWYFAEITKMKADIGVSEVEKQAAGAGEDA